MPSVGSADRRFIGSILLVVVNILWVLSTELTSFIFIDEDFRRPFFTVYVKTCMLCIYFVRYLFSSPSESEHKYKILNEESDLEMDEVNVNALEPEGFETVSTISESDNEGDPVRRIRFSERREVRRLPSSEAIDAQRARLPYREVLACSDYFTCSPRLKYAVFFFAPMWLACSFTYQAALLFTSVSSLNLISCSSSLFVLILSTCLPSKKAKFTLVKAILVLLNLAGVLIVSQFSTKLTGAVLAQISAIAYAIYLVMYARFMDRYGEIDMNLMFGSVGLLGVIVGTPLIFVLDVTGYEKLYPLPDSYQLSSIVLSAVFGTLLADYLWLMAAGMTDSVSASLSLTLSIPLSFLADSLFRSSPPSMLQLFAAVPITLSFIGAALVEQNSSQTRVTVTGDQDQESLLTNDEDEPEL